MENDWDSRASKKQEPGNGNPKKVVCVCERWGANIIPTIKMSTVKNKQTSKNEHYVMKWDKKKAW